MRYLLVFMFVILLVITVSVLNISKLPDKKQPIAVNGVYELNDWDFDEDGQVKLNGEWEFYWNRLFCPEDFANGKVEQKDFTRVPGPWTKYKVNGKNLPHEGFATFRLLVRSNSSRENMALKYRLVVSACKIWVDKKLVFECGNVSHDEKEHKDQITPQIIPVSLGKSTEIIVQVSNYGYSDGGFIVSFALGNIIQVFNARRRLEFMDVFIFSSIVIMGLYHLAWFLTFMEEKSTLIFGIICLMVAIRVLTMGEMLLYSIIPITALCEKLATFTLAMSLMLMAMFIKSLFPEETPKAFVLYLQVISTLYCILLFLTPQNINASFYSVYEVLAIPCLPYMYFILICSARNKRNGSVIALTAMSILLIVCINDVLTQLGFLRIGYFIPQGFTMFIYVQAFMLASKFSNSFKTIKNLSERLILIFHLKAQKEEMLLKSELRTLQAQIKPHFLFNSLNMVIHVCRISPQKAIGLLTDLSNFLRCGFSFKNDDEFIDIEREILHVKSYISIEMARFQNRLNVIFDIDEGIECKVPPFILQPIVENAILHGLLPKIDGGILKISIKLLNKVVLIKIEDDGVGMSEECVDSILKEKNTKAGIGVANVNMRLKKIYGTGLKIESRQDQGTAVTMKIPVLDDKHNESRNLYFSRT